MFKNFLKFVDGILLEGKIFSKNNFLQTQQNIVPGKNKDIFLIQYLSKLKLCSEDE